MKGLAKFMAIGASGLLAAALIAMPQPASAGSKDRPIRLVQCAAPIGSVAVIEGETRSWVDKKLGSPASIIEALSQSSGCFTKFDPNSGVMADFILSIVAGDQIEVASATNLNSASMANAAALAQNSGYRSGIGMVGDVAGMVPLAGAVINGAAGLIGIGKKRTIATGLTLIEPSDAAPLVAGTGFVQKTKLKFNDDDDDAMALMEEGYWMGAVEHASAGRKYTQKGDGRELVHGFVMAFNNLVAQSQAMGIRPLAELQLAQDQARSTAAQAAAEADAQFHAQAEAASLQNSAPIAEDDRFTITVAVTSSLYAQPARDAEVVRAIRPGMTLMPIGELEGIFLPVRGPYGVLGWASVEDLE